jgi:hypothetical protein
MIGYILTTAILLSLFLYYIIYPIVYYFLDPKCLRKYPNLNLTSGITDLGFVYESNKGFRSNALLEAHKGSSVVRIGPNSLSYSDLAAVNARLFPLHTAFYLISDRTYMGTTPNASKTSFMTLLLAPTIISPMLGTN